MPFPEDEKQAMLQLKGVGPTVITRLEALGFSKLSELADQAPKDITFQIAQMLRSTCWHNSPQANTAINAVIELAKARRDINT